MRKDNNQDAFNEDQQEWVDERKTLAKEVYHYSKTLDIKSKLMVFSFTTTMKSDVLKSVEDVKNWFNERDFEQEKLYTSLKKIRYSVKDLHRIMSHFESSEKKSYKDVENMQKSATDIESLISSYKQEGGQCFEVQNKQTEELDGFVTHIATKIENGEYNTKILGSQRDIASNDQENVNQNVNSKLPPKMPPKAPTGLKPTNNNPIKIDYVEDLYEDIGEDGREYKFVLKKIEGLGENLNKINDLIEENGGVDCGWKKDDVKVFTKFKARHQSNLDSKEFQEELKIHLPLNTEQELIDYIEKHKKYLYLDEKKKEIFQINNDLKDQKKKRELSWLTKKDELKFDKESKLREFRMQENTQKKEMVRKWKQQREISSVISKDKTQEMKEHMLKQKDADYQKVREQQKKAVEEFKEMKEVKRMREEQRKEIVQRQHSKTRYVSSEQRERIKMKEDNLLQKKRQLVSQKQDRMKEKEHREQVLKAKTSRRYSGVSSKQDHETVGVLGKQRDKFDPIKDKGKWGDNMAGDMVRNAGRAIPTWRQGT